MKTRKFFLSVLICMLLQATVLQNFRILNTKPNLIFLCVLLAAVELNAPWAYAVAVCAAILKDAFAVQAFGVAMILFPCWVFFARFISKKIHVDDKALRYVFFFAAIFLNSILQILIFIFIERPTVSAGIFLRTAFMESLLTVAFLPLLQMATATAPVVSTENNYL